MSHNSFGHLFRVTTWGESHGPALGCTVDGAPPRVPILGAAVYTGVFVAVVSNGSYQILQGLVERGWWGDRRALLFVGRAGRSLMASALAIRGMQVSGLQAVTAPPPR